MGKTRNRRILTEFEQEVIERLDRMEKMLLSLVNDSAESTLGPTPTMEDLAPTGYRFVKSDATPMGYELVKAE